MAQSKALIIEQIAKDKLVEEIVANLGTNETQFNRDDLIQDVYLELLTKNERLIKDLYENNQMRFYITRIVINNIFSKTSPYYLKYKKTDTITQELRNEL